MLPGEVLPVGMCGPLSCFFRIRVEIMGPGTDFGAYVRDAGIFLHPFCLTEKNSVNRSAFHRKVCPVV